MTADRGPAPSGPGDPAPSGPGDPAPTDGTGGEPAPTDGTGGQAAAGGTGAAPNGGQNGKNGHTAETSGRPPYRAVKKRYERQVEASRRARRRRMGLATVGTMSALTLLVAGIVWLVAGYVSASLTRLDAGTSGTPTSGPINILVAGIDTRAGLTFRQEVELHVGHDIGTNSDTLMLAHIPANHQSIQVVSLPRDSWVNIPGHGMNKINAAYGLGGPRLMVNTVEQATGLTINDYVEVDFLGFVKVIDVLGGVNICVPYAIDDPYTGLHLSAGRHHVNGVTALKFARDRHSFATSDLARIEDQQQLLSSLLAEATTSGVLANPVQLQQVVASVTAAVKVDNGFNVVGLADELRGVRPSDVSFTTVPIASANYTTPTGESAVLWNAPAAARLFSWLQNNTGPVRQAPSHSAAPSGQSTASQDACQ